MGRPRKADRPLVVARICAAIATGTLVKDACAAENITRQALHQWTAADTVLLDAYARAREEQAHAIAEEAIAIADSEALTAEAVGRNRLRVDTRKWLASKIAPRNYGEKVSAEISGPEGKPIEVRGSITWGSVEIPL